MGTGSLRKPQPLSKFWDFLITVANCGLNLLELCLRDLYAQRCGYDRISYNLHTATTATLRSMAETMLPKRICKTIAKSSPKAAQTSVERQLSVLPMSTHS